MMMKRYRAANFIFLVRSRFETILQTSSSSFAPIDKKQRRILASKRIDVQAKRIKEEGTYSNIVRLFLLISGPNFVAAANILRDRNMLKMAVAELT